MQLDEVVVSTKETFHYKELPVSASALTGRQLERADIRSLKSLSAFVPNFFASDYGSKLYTPVYIRGIGTRTSTGAPSVGLYVDGIPYFETASFDFDFFDLERLEVLRGPQGTLYGRNTMAGIINITTPSPLQHRATKIRLSYGAYGDAKAGASYSGKIGERLGLAAAVNYDRRGGYFVNRFTGKPADSRNDISARLRLDFQHSGKAQSDLHATFEHSRQDGYAYGQYHPETGHMDSVNYDAPSFYQRDMLTAGYRFAYRTAWGNIRAITGWQQLSDNQTVDQDYSPRPVYVAVQTQRQMMLSQEIIAQSDFERNYRWVTGIFGFSQWKDKDVDVQFPTMNHYMVDDQQAVGAAVYHQSGVHDLFTKGLSLTLGLRLDYERVSQRYTYDIALKDSAHTVNRTADTNHSLDFFELLPKLALRYEIAGQAIYISAAKGYKTGGFNTSFREGYNEQTYHPESSWNYEMGVKLSFPHTTLDLSAFWIDWREQQISQVVALGNGNDGTVIHNAGHSQSKGIEATLNTRPVRNLNISFNGGYTNARFRSYIYSEKVDYSGNRIPWVPEYTLAAGVSYRIPFYKCIDDLILSTDYKRIGSIYWNEDNIATQKPYDLLDAGVSIGKGAFRLTFWARNICNTRYLVYYLKQAAVGQLAQQGRPFTFGADLKIEF